LAADQLDELCPALMVSAADPLRLRPQRALRVLALVEASTVTGPAKNLIEFAVRARQPGAAGVPVELAVAAFVRGASGNLFTAAAEKAGIRVDVISERGRFDRSVMHQLRHIVEARQPDIVQSHNFKAHFLVRATGIHRQHRWLAFHHGYTWPKLRVHLYNQLDRWSLTAADLVVTVCTAFAHDVERRGVAPRHIAILHNSVAPFVPAATAEVDALRKSLGLNVGTKVALCVGRLSREKGHADLLDALALLPRESRAHLRLLIVGEGPERGRIADRIQRLALGEAVTLVGFKPDLGLYYSLADLLVLASHSEGSPNALLEAIAAGLPVVATSVGGTPDIVRHGESALLVPCGDPPALSAAIDQLLGDPELGRQLGHRAIEVSQDFTPERYCRSLVQLYQNLVRPTSCLSTEAI